MKKYTDKMEWYALAQEERGFFTKKDINGRHKTTWNIDNAWLCTYDNALELANDTLLVLHANKAQKIAEQYFKKQVTE